MQKQKLTKRVTFRVTNDELDQLTRTAEVLGVRPSDAMRLALTSVNLAAGELAEAN